MRSVICIVGRLSSLVLIRVLTVLTIAIRLVDFANAFFREVWHPLPFNRHGRHGRLDDIVIVDSTGEGTLRVGHTLTLWKAVLLWWR
jgi:hypothetical protein